MFHRTLNLPKSNSFFLFGGRGTGKTTVLKQLFGTSCFYIDLLESKTEFEYSKDPDLILASTAHLKPNSWVVIDEVQKIPKLLDLVHKLIEEKKLYFALTGSSARKLKRGGANLLAGRAFVYHLHPLTHRELGDRFDLNSVLSFGSLPMVFDFIDEDKVTYLQSYVFTYLKEEIKEEQIVRRLDPFRRFLEVAAQSNGQIINYTNISKDVGVDVKTIQSYYTILEDTLLGFLIEPFHPSLRKRQRHNPKFYFFDLGVQRALSSQLDLNLHPKTVEYGNAFEHFIILEIIRLNSYLRKDYRFSYIRIGEKEEIDLVLEKGNQLRWLIEIKSSNHVGATHIKNLEKFSKEIKKSKPILLSLDPQRKTLNGVECVFWEEGLKELFNL